MKKVTCILMVVLSLSCRAENRKKLANDAVRSAMLAVQEVAQLSEGQIDDILQFSLQGDGLQNGTLPRLFADEMEVPLSGELPLGLLCWPYTRHVDHLNSELPKRKAAYEHAHADLARLLNVLEGGNLRNGGYLKEQLEQVGNQELLAKILGFFAFANVIKGEISYGEFLKYLPKRINVQGGELFALPKAICSSEDGDEDRFFKASLDHLILITAKIIESAITSINIQRRKAGTVPTNNLFLWHCILKGKLTHIADGDLWKSEVPYDGVFTLNSKYGGDGAFHVIKKGNRIDLTTPGEYETLRGSIGQGGSEAASARNQRISAVYETIADQKSDILPCSLILGSLDATVPFYKCVHQMTPAKARKTLVRLLFWEDAMSHISSKMVRDDLSNVEDITLSYLGTDMVNAILSQRMAAVWEGVLSHSQVMHRLGISRVNALEIWQKPEPTPYKEARSLYSSVWDSRLVVKMSADELLYLKLEYVVEDILESCEELVRTHGSTQGSRVIVEALNRMKNKDQTRANIVRLDYTLDILADCLPDRTAFRDFEKMDRDQPWKEQRETLKRCLYDLVVRATGMFYANVRDKNYQSLMDFVRTCTTDETVIDQINLTLEASLLEEDEKREGADQGVNLDRDWGALESTSSQESLDDFGSSIQSTRSQESLGELGGYPVSVVQAICLN